MSSNEGERSRGQRLGHRKNYWLWAKHAWLYSDFDSPGFSTQGTLISASAAPYSQGNKWEKTTTVQQAPLTCLFSILRHRASSLEASSSVDIFTRWEARILRARIFRNRPCTDTWEVDILYCRCHFQLTLLVGFTFRNRLWQRNLHHSTNNNNLVSEVLFHQSGACSPLQSKACTHALHIHTTYTHTHTHTHTINGTARRGELLSCYVYNVYHITPFFDLTHVYIHLLKYGAHTVLNCHGKVKRIFQTVLKIQQNWS